MVNREIIGNKMADENLPWSDQVDGIITDISKTTKDKYGFSLREMLLNPSAQIKQKDVDNARKAVSDYFDALMATLSDEKARLEKELQDADAQYTKIDEVIANKTASSRIPYIKPTFVDYDSQRNEEIVIEQYNASVDLLVTKLVSMANYVANNSAQYDKYNIGSWLFSGNRTYVLTINPPRSIVVAMEGNRDEIMGILDDLQSAIPAAAPSK